MTTTANRTPKARVMKDEELTTLVQLECRLAQLRSELVGPDSPACNKVKISLRIAAIKERITPSGVRPAIPVALLVSKADVAEWGDRQVK